MSSIFAKIINGEIPSHKVYEDENFLAFLDIRPMVKGHTLVIPKKEVDYLFDMNPEEYTSLLLAAQKVAKGIKKSVPCTKVGMTVIGLEVPHAHVHLMPINNVADMSFKNPVVEMTQSEMNQLAQLINKNIE
ncbi:MAG: HIT family protein [Saprospiraceae bacterium]|jgi:histidine triad (HIT) family protein|uniref:HIT family protein n=1 Tax=Candidatus Brachybacter algidus TaxID=2982024 RepID=UPI001B50F2EA|nr:HIT family protein [Candidatus Brachybacter algidus]MBP7541600.1 HIT family protein [Saprospiraceae bacterium]MBK6374183.1 HIT family protein [Candidatus Brachybacter algidus]MBK6450009.1 HIT family protein [Candidatus Brachybacter algidus]MBK7604116.1 HIT family protein [Candidatus Brachybacter algidus]MBK8353886.1 HIT family protein [Candidatus Brachybacter algidus]